MDKKDPENPAVPEQVEGKEVNLEESVTADTAIAAQELYHKACERLLHPGEWHELAGALSAFFKVDSFAPNRKIKEKDHLQIDLPAPGNPAGDGHDWVIVETISTKKDGWAEENLSVTLRASENPDKPGDGIAHFFDEGATSSFVIKRKGNTVVASYHGRNEKLNTEGGLGNKIRNALVAIGALAGLSEIQWKALLKGLLKN